MLRRSNSQSIDASPTLSTSFLHRSKQAAARSWGFLLGLETYLPGGTLELREASSLAKWGDRARDERGPGKTHCDSGFVHQRCRPNATWEFLLLRKNPRHAESRHTAPGRANAGYDLLRFDQRGSMMLIRVAYPAARSAFVAGDARARQRG